LITAHQSRLVCAPACQTRLVCAPAHQSRLACVPARQSRLVCVPARQSRLACVPARLHTIAEWCAGRHTTHLPELQIMWAQTHIYMRLGPMGSRPIIFFSFKKKKRPGGLLVDGTTLPAQEDSLLVDEANQEGILLDPCLGG
jgi:hypothetical protein